MTRSTIRRAGAAGLATLLTLIAAGGTAARRATEAPHGVALAQFCVPQDDADSYRFYCRFSGG
jgi:hypothetical protein